jgi:hypothetical protein
MKRRKEGREKMLGKSVARMCMVVYIAYESGGRFGKVFGKVGDC